MGKITVKHYLNTKVKPKQGSGDSLLYPVYVQVIYNKFSTNKRSQTEMLMTKKGFDYYCKEKKLLDNEFEKGILYFISPLEKELIDIESSIKVIEKWDLDIKRNNIFRAIDEFSTDVLTYFTDKYRFELDYYCQMGAKNEENYNTEYEAFLLSFNDNIIESIERIEEYTKVDLKKYIKDENLLHFRIFKLISKIQKRYWETDKKRISFAEFVCMDYENIIKKELKQETLEYTNKLIETINKLIDNFVEQGSIIYLDYDEIEN